MLKKLFAPGNNSFLASFGLLVLRLWFGLAMFFDHGVAKLTHFSQVAPHFPDLIGIGPAASLALATFAEFFATLLLAIGLVTRFAALALVVNMSVAFFLAMKASLSQANGELAFLYLAAYVVLLITGPGKLSVDGALFGK